MPYDSWGKLISIDGTLKDTVGVKNPYRYRSYRYDTETGLYYLQSRYYNPEWGRFINNDSIAGSVGELLSHNIFIYCKNNSIIKEDPTGHREIYEATLQEESSEERHASIAAMNKNYHDNRTYKKVKQNTKRIFKDLGVSLTSSVTEELSKPFYFILNREMERSKYKGIFIPGSKTAGVVCSVLTIYGYVETYMQIRNEYLTYGVGEATGRAVIDISVTMFTLYAGSVLSPIGGAIIGTGLDYGGDYLKNIIYND